MSGVLIRPSAEEDLPFLAELERENFSEPWSEASFREELTNDYGITLTACLDKTVAGYLNAHLVWGSLHINTFCVSSAFRRKGIASQLMESLLALAVEKGVEEATLEVRSGNEAAQGLYRKYGFEPIGIRKRFYKAPEEDAVLMKKEFSDD